MNKFTFRGGIHVNGHKEVTNSLGTLLANIPDKVYIPLSQHIGSPCTALVKVGDEVKKGQKIGEGKGFVTAPIHASVSGKVIAIETKAHPGGGYVPCIVIENDRKEEWAESVEPCLNPENLTSEEIRKIVLDAGIVGMGGATFPTHVKYSPNPEKKVEVVLLNGAECEPYLTADHRIMLEKAERIVKGLHYIMNSVNCPKGIIAVEDNKLDAVEVLQKAAQGEKGIEVIPFKEKYPQGSEKQLIYAAIGREVPVGGLPLDVGAIVNNVGTAVAIADAVEKGIPLIERIVTVSGTGVQKPANYTVRMGTLFKDLIEQSGGYTGEIAKVISGGLMMGKTVYTDDMPVIKGTSGIVVLKKEDVQEGKEYSCVRCAKCVDACPAFLEPTTLANLSKMERWEEAEANNALSCIECGSCAYVCPAKINIVQHIRRAKQMIISAKKKAKK